MSEILLLNVSGRDKPGLTASLAAILARYRVNILDIGQSVIHETLSLGMLIEIPDEAGPSPVLKELVFRAHELDVDLRFTPVTDQEYDGWVDQQKSQRYIITLLGPRISAEHIARIADILSEERLNIDDITRLSERPRLGPSREVRGACIELAVRGHTNDPSKLRSALVGVARDLDIDLSFQEDTVYRRNRRLVAFDMDSTLVRGEIIDELARLANVGEEVAAITSAAMAGELDFVESYTRRLRLLAGLPVTLLEEVAADLPLNEGAERLIRNLKALGYKIAILSGGFNYFALRLQEQLSIDYVCANDLEIAEGVLTGRVKGAVVDGQKKAEELISIAEREQINLEQVIAVGDGANDLPMLNVAGLGIAFQAHPVVREGAQHAISTVGLDGILYLLGIRDRETN